MIYTLLLLLLGGLLAGGAISLRQQKAHVSWIIACWILAGLSLFAGYMLTF